MGHFMHEILILLIAEDDEEGKNTWNIINLAHYIEYADPSVVPSYKVGREGPFSYEFYHIFGDDHTLRRHRWDPSHYNCWMVDNR